MARDAGAEMSKRLIVAGVVLCLAAIIGATIAWSTYWAGTNTSVVNLAPTAVALSRPLPRKGQTGLFGLAAAPGLQVDEASDIVTMSTELSRPWPEVTIYTSTRIASMSTAGQFIYRRIVGKVGGTDTAATEWTIATRFYVLVTEPGLVSMGLALPDGIVFPNPSPHNQYAAACTADTQSIGPIAGTGLIYEMPVPQLYVMFQRGTPFVNTSYTSISCIANFVVADA